MLVYFTVSVDLEIEIEAEMSCTSVNIFNSKAKLKFKWMKEVGKQEWQVFVTQGGSHFKHFLREK